MLSPGRTHDMEVLKTKYSQARTVDERNRWADRINQLHKEGESRRIRELRYKLIAAYRNNDSDLAADISHVIWKESMTEKLRSK